MKERQGNPSRFVANGDVSQSRLPAVCEAVESNMQQLIPTSIRAQLGPLREDVMQAMRIGALEAAQKVDPSHSGEPLGYVFKRARGAAVDEVRAQMRHVGMSRSRIRLFQEVARATEALAQHLERVPTITEVAQHLDIPTSRIAEMLIAKQQYSLDAPNEHLDSEESGYGFVVAEEEGDLSDQMVATHVRERITHLAIGTYGAAVEEGEPDPVDLEKAVYDRHLATRPTTSAPKEPSSKRSKGMSEREIEIVFGELYRAHQFEPPELLSPREWVVLRARMVHGYSNLSIGAMVGLHPSRVSQIITTIHKRLERRLREEELI